MVWNSNAKRRQHYHKTKNQTKARKLLQQRLVMAMAPATNTTTTIIGHSHAHPTTVYQPESQSTFQAVASCSSSSTNNVDVDMDETHADSDDHNSESETETSDSNSDDDDETKEEYTVGLENQLILFQNETGQTRMAMVKLLAILNSNVGKIIVNLPKYPVSLSITNDGNGTEPVSKVQQRREKRFYLQTDSFLYIGITRALNYLFEEEHNKKKFMDAGCIKLCFNFDGLPVSREYFLGV